MSILEKDMRSLKEETIDLLKIAESNLLMSIVGLKPDEIYKQITPETNHICWIFGHCASHMDFIFGELCQGKRLLSDEEQEHYAYDASKEIVIGEPPKSFGQLVETYLRISEDTFEYLKKLPEEKLRENPEIDAGKEIKESLIQAIDRVALHYLGHMGQITLIRRAIGNPGGALVGGIAEKNRDQMYAKWKEWWKENKEFFK